MSANGIRGILATAVFVIGAAGAARAQDCASSPLLGRRFAAAAQVSHSTLGETGVAASLTSGVSRVHVGGALQSTRMDDVDRPAYEGRLSVWAPVSFAGFDLCPTTGVGYGQLTTDKSGTHGHVTTREVHIGASVEHAFEFVHSTLVTPFIEPVLVRRSVSWESVDASWRVSSKDSDHETQVWLGASVATPNAAVVARLRPSRAGGPRELSVAFVAAFGRR